MFILLLFFVTFAFKCLEIRHLSNNNKTRTRFLFCNVEYMLRTVFPPTYHCLVAPTD